MICHRRKLIFIHLPKCAGTSVEVAFTGKGWHEGDLRGEQHLTAKETRELYGDDTYSAYFKFAIVRNPWDLLIAYYLWGCWGLRGHADRTLKGRVKRLLGKTPGWGHPFRKEGSDGGEHPSFAEYLNNTERLNAALRFSPSGKDLTHQRAALAIDGALAVDYVGRFESLQEDINTACTQAGIESVALPHRLKSTRAKHYSRYYTNKTREIVRRRYGDDIEAFGYSFEDSRALRW